MYNTMEMAAVLIIQGQDVQPLSTGGGHMSVNFADFNDTKCLQLPRISTVAPQLKPLVTQYYKLWYPTIMTTCVCHMLLHFQNAVMGGNSCEDMQSFSM